MERLAEKQYKFEASKNKLKHLGFRYNKNLEGYSRMVEVYKYKNTVPMIYCKITHTSHTEIDQKALKSYCF